MEVLLLIILIGVILYFAYWKKAEKGTWHAPIQSLVKAVSKPTKKITTLIYRKYKRNV